MVRWNQKESDSYKCLNNFYVIKIVEAFNLKIYTMKNEPVQGSFFL